MKWKPPWGPIITLVLIAPCLTELLSGNTPAARFLKPQTLLPLMLVYGVPVLLIRDLRVRWNLRVPGLFVVGLAYGIYNEGVIAQTLRLSSHVPIDAFDGYRFLGLNWPWMAVILPWHSIHAVLFPIAIVSWLYPAAKSRRWLSTPWFNVCLCVVILFGTLVNLTARQLPASPAMLALFFAAIACLTSVAGRLRGEAIPSNKPTHICPMAVVGGILFYPLFILSLVILGHAKAPALLICVASGLLLLGAYRLLSRMGWLSPAAFLMFAFGDYLSGTAFMMKSAIHHGSFFGVVSGFILAAAMGAGIFLIGRAEPEAISLHERGEPG